MISPTEKKSCRSHTCAFVLTCPSSTSSSVLVRVPCLCPRHGWPVYKYMCVYVGVYVEELAFRITHNKHAHLSTPTHHWHFRLHFFLHLSPWRRQSGTHNVRPSKDKTNGPSIHLHFRHESWVCIVCLCVCVCVCVCVCKIGIVEIHEKRWSMWCFPFAPLSLHTHAHTHTLTHSH